MLGIPAAGVAKYAFALHDHELALVRRPVMSGLDLTCTGLLRQITDAKHNAFLYLDWRSQCPVLPLSPLRMPLDLRHISSAMSSACVVLRHDVSCARAYF